MTQTLIPQTSTRIPPTEAELARRIEAGVLAEAVRTGGVRMDEALPGSRLYEKLAATWPHQFGIAARGVAARLDSLRITARTEERQKVGSVLLIEVGQ